MTKLFLIIVATGKIGGAAGPLPYGMDECERRRAEMAEAVADAWRNPDIIAKLHAKHPAVTADTYRFECRWLARRPELGSVYRP